MTSVLNTFLGKNDSSVSCWLMRQSGRYLLEYHDLRAKRETFIEFCLSPDIVTQATLLPLNKFDLDAAIIFSDILMIPYALGQNVKFIQGKGPVLNPIRNYNDLKQLSDENLSRRLAPVYDAITQVSQQLGEEKTLIGFAGAPWTVASYMIEGSTSKEFSVAKKFAISYPSVFAELMKLITESTIKHLINQVHSGAQVLQLFDSWAGCVPEVYFENWVINPTRSIVMGVKKVCPGVPIIGFPKGVGAHYPNYVRKTGVDGISLDSMVPLNWVLSQIPDHIVTQGALDPQILVSGGYAMEKEVDRQLNMFSKRKHVFNLGHGIVPETPPEHVQELLKLIKRQR